MFQLSPNTNISRKKNLINLDHQKGKKRRPNPGLQRKHRNRQNHGTRPTKPREHPRWEPELPARRTRTSPGDQSSNGGKRVPGGSSQQSPSQIYDESPKKRHVAGRKTLRPDNNHGFRGILSARLCIPDVQLHLPMPNPPLPQRPWPGRNPHQQQRPLQEDQDAHRTTP